MNELSELFQHANTVVEIGTHLGDFAYELLRNNKTCHLWCIDPYKQYEDYEDSINTFTGDNVFEHVSNKLNSAFPDRVTFIRKFSADAVNDIPDNVDMVFIDGNHKYRYVLEDLEKYYPKLKPGGAIVGDDAIDTDEVKRDSEGNIFVDHGECSGKYGVIKAFEQFKRSLKDAVYLRTATRAILVKKFSSDLVKKLSSAFPSFPPPSVSASDY